jgi:hypothetical protein
MKRVFMRVVLILISLISADCAFATHNRAGEITWVQTGDLTFMFTITTYTDPNSPADRSSLGIAWGDGQTDTLLRTSIIPLTPDIQQNKYEGSHTYSGYST